ncbi:MAG: DivIVA domain-containing protein, partial [Armatimonadetes bacterium]
MGGTAHTDPGNSARNPPESRRRDRKRSKTMANVGPGPQENTRPVFNRAFRGYAPEEVDAYLD